MSWVMGPQKSQRVKVHTTYHGATKTATLLYTQSTWECWLLFLAMVKSPAPHPKKKQFKEERVYIRLQLQKGRIHNGWRRHGSRSRKERDHISFANRKKEAWAHEPSQTISNDVIPPARPHTFKIGFLHTVFLDMHYVIIIITSISKAL